MNSEITSFHASASRLRAVGVLIAGCLWLALAVPPAALAQQPAAAMDSPIPLTTPLPTSGLVMTVDGGTAAARTLSKQSLTVYVADMDVIQSAAPDPTMGPYLHFSDKSDTRLGYQVADFVPFSVTTKLGTSPVSTAGGDGVTVALWLRFNTSDKAGLIPLFRQGFCVSTTNGALAVHDCLKAPTAAETSASEVIADNEWHHLALRVSIYSVDLFLDGKSALSLPNNRPLDWLQSEMRLTTFGTQQSYFEGAHKSPTDVAKLYVYHLPLNISDIQAIRAVGLAGLAFQFPPLDSYILEFIPTTASARPRSATDAKQTFDVTLPTLPASAALPPLSAEIDLLRYHGTGKKAASWFHAGGGNNVLMPINLADSLRGATQVTAAGWVRWPDLVDATGKVAMRWQPTVTPKTGWSLRLAGTGDAKAKVIFQCGNGTTATYDVGRTDAQSAPQDVTNRWHFFVVRPVNDDGVEVFMNQTLLGTVQGCTGHAAPVYVGPTTPALTTDLGVQTAYSAIFLGRKPLSTLAQFIAPGPTLYAALVRLADKTDDWSAALSADAFVNPNNKSAADGAFGASPDSGGRAVRVWYATKAALNWLFMDDTNPAFTFSTSLQIATTGAKSGPVVLASRTFAKSGTGGALDYGSDVRILLECAKDNSGCGLSVETPTTAEYEKKAPATAAELADNKDLNLRFRRSVPFVFKANTSYRVTVAWPYIHPNFDTPSLPDILEPAVFIDGKLLNDVQNLKIVDGSQTASQSRYASTEQASWELGSAKNDPSFTFLLADTRIYPRAVLEGIDLGRNCAQSKTCEASYLQPSTPATQVYVASPTCTCSTCKAGTFRVAAAGVSGEECQPKRALYGSCVADEQCVSGTCSNLGSAAGFCVFSGADKEKCNYSCATYGRQCIAEGAGFTCGDCRPGWVLEPGKKDFAVTSPDRNCAYNPTLKDGEPCEHDASCLSGMCKETILKTTKKLIGGKVAKADTWGSDDAAGCDRGYCNFQVDVYANTVPASSRYPVDDVKAKVCMASSASVCSNQKVKAGPPMTVTPQVIQPPEAKNSKSPQALLAYECQYGGKTGCFNPNDERKSRILDPEACYFMLNAKEPYLKDEPDRTKNWTWQREKQGACTQSSGVCWPWPISSCSGCNMSLAADHVEDLPRYLTMKKKGYNLTVKDLKVLFLNSNEPYAQSDYGKLIEAGVGTLLFEYARASESVKKDMEEQYGAFQPVGACDAGLNKYFGVADGVTAYEKSNDVACQPKVQDNGAACKPPPDASAPDILPTSTAWQEGARRYCKSYYCNRVSQKCDDGDNPLEEIRLTRDGENVSRNGSQGTQFGIVRMDYLNVNFKAKTCDGGMAVDAQTGECKAGLAAEKPSRFGELESHTSNKYTLMLFGQAILTIFGVENNATVDTVGPDPNAPMDKKCTSGGGKLIMLGYEFDAAEPPEAGECNIEGAPLTDGGWLVCGKSCPKTPEKEIAHKFNLLTGKLSFQVNSIKQAPWGSDPDEGQAFCLPLERIPPLKKFLDKYASKDKQFTVGPVPVFVSAGVAPAVCVNVRNEIASDGFPVLKVEPTIALEADAKIAIGVSAKGIANKLPQLEKPTWSQLLDPAVWSAPPLTPEQKAKKEADKKAKEAEEKAKAAEAEKQKKEEKEAYKKMSDSEKKKFNEKKKAEKKASPGLIEKGKKAAKKSSGSAQAGVGLKLELLLIKLGFPIVQGTTAISVKAGEPVNQIYNVNVFEKVNIRISTLGGNLAFWAGAGVGPFKLELVVPILEWPSLRWEWELSHKDVLKVVVDFLANFPHPNIVLTLPKCDPSKTTDACDQK